VLRSFRSSWVPAIAAATLSLFVMSASSRPAPGNDSVEFSQTEINRILQHAIQPPQPDPTNRFADDPRAAHFGQFLFFEKSFSANGAVSCATCHDPALDFTDGKPLAAGVAEMHRHTPSLWNVAHNRWLFWDGRADTLWSQALDPMEQEKEFGGNRTRIAHLIYNDQGMRQAYETIFGPMPDLSNSAHFPADARPVPSQPEHPHHVAWNSMAANDQDAVNRVFANIGKALAAYERLLSSDRSPFDQFVEGLKNKGASRQSILSVPAQRGLKLFVGEANCRLCHAGPNFTDGEFHNTGAPPRPDLPQDSGRYEGASRVIKNPFNALSPFSDDVTAPTAQQLSFLAQTPESWGEFKTPSLRNVARTAPYMHQGQFASLRDVIEFYSTRETAVQIGHHQETILVPLNLSQQQIADLVAFLEALNGETLPQNLLVQPPSPAPALEP
jgi:cytochrome c peroxidase